MEDRIIEQEAEIHRLKAQLREAHQSSETSSSILRNQTAELMCLQSSIVENESQLRESVSQLENAENALSEVNTDLSKSRKRIQRLVREKALFRKSYLAKLYETNANQRKIFSDLSGFLDTANAKASRLEESSQNLTKSLAEEKSTTKRLRKKVHSLNMQQHRAKAALQATRRDLMDLSVWKATKGGVYTKEARRLSRELLRAGCAGERVGDAMSACAKAFGVRVDRILSRRTVFRARDEGGHFGLMQLGREIIQSKGNHI